MLKATDNDRRRNRFGIIIGSKAIKKSTERIFWKRKIIDFLATLPNAHKDFLLIVKSGLSNLAPKKLEEEIKKAFDTMRENSQNQ